MSSEAEAQFQKVRVLAGDSPYGLGDWGGLLARTGRPAQARRVLADLQDFDRRRYAVHVDMAKVHLALGDNERALTLLEQAHHNLEMLNMVKVDPAWQELRRDPRFRNLLERMNLAP